MINYNKVLEKFNNGSLDKKSINEISDKLKVRTKTDKRLLSSILSQLVANSKIKINGRKYFYIGERSGEKTLKKARGERIFIKGVVRLNENGFAVLTAVDGKTFFIPKGKTKGLFDGDIVLARRVFSSLYSDRVNVLSVLEHGTKKVVGTFVERNGYKYIATDYQNFFHDVLLDAKSLIPKLGERVVVRLVKYPEKGMPVGVVERVLGDSGELIVEEECLIESSGIRFEFDEKTLDEASSISQKISDNELIGRLNLKNTITFTIDGINARDFDDAISLEINERGNYVLGVHIADVSHYVTPKSCLDKEAFLRGNSVYLPDRVIPMLPFELSNGICSLNEGVDRLTLSVISEIDKLGNTISNKFYKSVIKSKHRLTYAEVQKIIEGDKSLREKYSDIRDIIDKMQTLNKLLKEKRLKNGEIDLMVKESDISYKNGVVEVTEHLSCDSTRLIEQFMIYANEAVARYLFEMHAPSVYRIHEKPSPEKIEAFNDFLAHLGISAKILGKNPIEYKNLLDKLKDNKAYEIINKMMLRSMQKAVYSTQNVGHFGLASDCYLHFTSPIRRYPDLLVHRILKSIIDGRKSELIDLYADFSKKVAQNSSLAERNAELLERNVDDLYKVEYIKDYIGHRFEGTISGVQSFGLFVELENSIEGLIRVESLKGNYIFDSKKMTLKGSKESFTFGDKVKIRVVSASIAARRIEFNLVDKISVNLLIKK